MAVNALGGTFTKFDLVINHFENHRVFVHHSGNRTRCALVTFPLDVHGRHQEVAARVLNLKRLSENCLEVTNLVGELIGTTKFDKSIFDAIQEAAKIHDRSFPEHQNQFLKVCVGSCFVEEYQWKTPSDQYMPLADGPETPDNINMGGSGSRVGGSKKPSKQQTGKVLKPSAGSKTATKKKPSAKSAFKKPASVKK